MNALANAERHGRMINAAGARLWAEATGAPDAPVVLLVHRMAAQGFEWPDELLDALVGAGYRTITFDHRGFGWSESGPVEPPMSFQDLIDDTLAVLRAFDVTRAHLIGSSVGGVIARCAAKEWAGTTLSITFLGSSPGDGSLPVWTPAYTEVALAPPGPSVAERIDYLVRELRVMGDDRFDETVATTRAARAVDRGWTLDALRRVARAAKYRSLGERDFADLRQITCPCLVVHGTDDAVLGVDHGRLLAASVPGAQYLELDGMGHDIQGHWVREIVAALLPTLRRGDAALRPTGGQ